MTFVDWVRGYQRATQIERREMIQAGLELAQARRAEMARMIREDPQQAMQEALTPRQYGALPPEVRELVERLIVTVGMYTVAAICHHGPDEPHGSGCHLEFGAILGFGTFEAEFFRAGSVYGSRKHRQTEEEASLYGVVMDGYMALHEDDVVLVDDGEGQAGGRFAVYYRGHEHLFDDYAAAVEFRQYLIDQQGKEP